MHGFFIGFFACHPSIDACNDTHHATFIERRCVVTRLASSSSFLCVLLILLFFSRVLGIFFLFDAASFHLTALCDLETTELEPIQATM